MWGSKFAPQCWIKGKLMFKIKKVIGFFLAVTTIAGSVYYKDFVNKNAPVTFTINFSNTRINNPEMLKEAILFLNENPDYEVRVVGHSGTFGNPAANQRLSYERAKIVARELVGRTQDYSTRRDDIHLSRVDFVGVGSDQILPLEEGESDRAYQRRLSRVEIEAFVDMMDHFSTTKAYDDYSFNQNNTKTEIKVSNSVSNVINCDNCSFSYGVATSSGWRNTRSNSWSGINGGVK